MNLGRKGFLQEDEAKTSSKPVQLEGVSGHRLEGGEREADLAVRLVRLSIWSTDDVKEAWLPGTFYEATIKYDLFLGQPGSISQRAIRAVLCHTHSARVFNTSKREISYKFQKMSRNLKGINQNPKIEG